MGLSILFIVQLNSPGFARSVIIAAYVGPGMPINGIDQAIDLARSVVPDGAGGFYPAVATQNRVCCVLADGKLSLVAGGETEGCSDGGSKRQNDAHKSEALWSDGADYETSQICSGSSSVVHESIFDPISVGSGDFRPGYRDQWSHQLAGYGT